MTAFIIKLAKNFIRNDVTGTAAQTAFFLTLSIPPLMVLALSVSTSITAADTILSYLEFVFPASVSTVFEEVLMEIPKSSKVTIISTIGVVFSASGSIWALMKGIHKTFTYKKLGFSLKNRLVALAFTIVFVFSITVSLGSLIIGGVLSALVDTLSNSSLIFDLSKRIAAVIAVYMFVHSIYRFTPDVRHKGSELFWGALFAACGWVAVSMLFGNYIVYFTKYTTVYGGIGAFFILILWLYIISFIILLGAQINSTLCELKNPSGRHNVL